MLAQYRDNSDSVAAAWQTFIYRYRYSLVSAWAGIPLGILLVGAAASALSPAVATQLIALRQDPLVVAAGLLLVCWHIGGGLLLAYGLWQFLKSEQLHAAALIYRHSTAIASISEAVISIDQHSRVQYMNPMAAKLSGWDAQLAQDQSLNQVLRLYDIKTGAALTPDWHNDLTQQAHAPLQQQALLRRERDGEEYTVEYTLKPVFGNTLQGNGIIIVLKDITSSHNLTQRMHYLATHDSLTELLNRDEFERRAEIALQQVRSQKLYASLLFLDLDHFKIFNDSYGHLVGNSLLKQVATTLKQSTEDGTIIARLGDDEFALLLHDHNLERACGVAEHLRLVINAISHVPNDTTLELSASLGLVALDDELDKLAEFMGAANAAVNIAKDLGRNRVHVYQADDRIVAQRQGEYGWMQRIQAALENDEFLLYFQEIKALDLRAQNDVNCEFLIRMQSEDGEIIYPGNFISVAERYNMMPAIDRWVLRSALNNIPTMPGFGYYTINLSGQSLGDDYFLNYVIDSIEKSQVAPEKICFEITETAAISNLSRAIRFINELKRIGCKFALDDFGSGLSSFAYLKNLNVDYLKIDGDFIKDMLDDPINTSMVKTINHIGHIMGLRTIAEYVENDATLTRLRMLGVDYAQGYEIAKPVHVDTQRNQSDCQLTKIHA